jgi:phosphonate transport system ATP-binding protein
MIEATSLGMRYATGKVALDNASLSVAQGEMVVVLGHNGSGKSTMLRCIAGMLRPTAGSVKVAGQELTLLSGRPLAQARMALGMVFQQPYLVQRRSVMANVLSGTLGRNQTLWTALGGMPKRERGFATQCLAHVGLGALAQQRAGTLSGGQAQRVSVARALAQAPKALLADEPVASLDPDAAEELMRLLRRLAIEDQLAVVCVLHQPELALRYADRVVGLRQGRVVFTAKPAELTPRDISSLYERHAA